MHFVYNQVVILLALKISGTILLAVLCNILLRSFIRVPKHLRSRKSQTYISVLRNTISVIVYAIAFHYILIILGVNITPLLASAGIVGLAVGLGARPVIEDVITGIFLLSQGALVIGDYIVVDDTEGFIESMGLRTISVRDESGALTIIPNGMVKKVTNYSRGKTHVYIDIPVKADQTINTVLKAISTAVDQLQKDKKSESDVYPESKVLGIDNITLDNRVMIRVDLVTTVHARWKMSKQLRLLIKEEFEKKKLVFA